MVTCQSSELDWEVTVELPADFLSLGRGSVSPHAYEMQLCHSMPIPCHIYDGCYMDILNHA